MTHALAQVYELLQADFAERGQTCYFDFGWLAPAEHTAGVEPRIVLVPGDESEAVGETLDYPDSITPITSTGQTVLGRVRTLARLYVTAPGSTVAPEDRLRQWSNTMSLRHDVYRALKRIAGTQITFPSERYDTAAARLSCCTIIMTIGVIDTISDDSDCDGEGLVRVAADVELQERTLVERFPVP